MQQVLDLIAAGEYSDALVCSSHKRYTLTTELFHAANELVHFESVSNAEPSDTKRYEKLLGIVDSITQLSEGSTAREVRHIAVYVRMRMSFFEQWRLLFADCVNKPTTPPSIFHLQWTPSRIPPVSVEDAQGTVAALHETTDILLVLLESIEDITAAMRRYDPLKCGLRVAGALQLLNSYLQSRFTDEQSNWELLEGWPQHQRYIACPRLRLIARIIWGLWGRTQLVFSHIFEPQSKTRVLTVANETSPAAKKPASNATLPKSQSQGFFQRLMKKGAAKVESPPTGSPVTPSPIPLKRRDVVFPSLLANGCADVCSAISEIMQQAPHGGRLCFVAHSQRTPTPDNQHTVSYNEDEGSVIQSDGLAMWNLCFCCGGDLDEKEKHNVLSMAAFQSVNMRTSEKREICEFSQRHLFFVRDAAHEIAEGMYVVLVRDTAARGEKELSTEMNGVSKAVFAAISAFLKTWGMPTELGLAAGMSL